MKSCTHSKIADLQNGIPFGKVGGKGDKGKWSTKLLTSALFTLLESPLGNGV